MNTVLFFHTSLRQAWRKELGGAYRFARTRGWRVQVIEPTETPPAIPELIRFWNPIGCIAECSGKPSDYFDVAAFGDTTNDNEMIAGAGLGVCMCNGSDDTKALADVISEYPANEDGFARFIDTYIL
jgi:hypothetical protein